MTKHVFLVDNSITSRTAIRQCLETRPEINVCGEAVDGLDALEKVRCLSPDLIIIDLAMPRMDGLEAARKLRTMMIKAPIILFTLYADLIPQKLARVAGVDAVVSKSDFPALSEQIDKLLAAC